ncbi:MAG: hypothetical protein ABSB32_00185 [Thermodesulfobacteriota bacterium]
MGLSWTTPALIWLGFLMPLLNVMTVQQKSYTLEATPPSDDGRLQAANYRIDFLRV